MVGAGGIEARKIYPVSQHFRCGAPADTPNDTPCEFRRPNDLNPPALSLPSWNFRPVGGYHRLPMTKSSVDAAQLLRSAQQCFDAVRLLLKADAARAFNEPGIGDERPCAAVREVDRPGCRLYPRGFESRAGALPTDR